MANGESADVLVVGSVNIDLVVQVASLPAPGQTVIGGTFSRHPGGKGANQAVAAARMGATVTFVGAVGDDELGASALRDLEAAGVDVSRCLTLGGVPTGVALVIVGAVGENLIAVASGANAALTGPLVEETLASWQPAASLAGPGVLLATFEVPDDAVVAAALVARQRGMQVVINPAPARALPASLVELGPILVPNEGEASALTGLADPTAAGRSLSAQTGAPVIVTLGAAGAIVVEADSVTQIPAPKVAALDTTGAGDTFAGVLAAELARGSELRSAARFAVAAASISVAAAGAREGVPDRATVNRLIRES
jgi:ribokinase